MDNNRVNCMGALLFILIDNNLQYKHLANLSTAIVYTGMLLGTLLPGKAVNIRSPSGLGE